MDKRKLSENEEEDLRSDVRPHFPPTEPLDTDDNDAPDADASGDLSRRLGKCVLEWQDGGLIPARTRIGRCDMVGV